MGNISEQLRYLSETKALIKNAIVSKNVSVPNGSTFRSYANYISQISTSSTSKEIGNDTAVAFIDYDGTVLYTYTNDELNNLTSLPGLVKNSYCGEPCGWTKTLSTIKQEVAISNYTEVGQMYEVLFSKNTPMASIEVEILNPNQATIEFGLTFEGMSNSTESGETLVIDWGDGNSYTTFANNGVLYPYHTYSFTGKYIINIYWSKCLSNSVSYPIKIDFGRTSLIVKGIEYGHLVSMSGFRNQPIEKILIQKTTNLTHFDSSEFNTCYKIKALVLPTTITTMDMTNGANGGELKHVLFPNGITGECDLSYTGIESFYMTAGVTYAEGCCAGCSRLKRVGLNPAGSSVNELPARMFEACTSIQYIKVPNTIIYIRDNAFGYNKLSILDLTDYEATAPHITSNSLAGIPDNGIIIFTSEAYEDALKWSTWNAFIEGREGEGIVVI